MPKLYYYGTKHNASKGSKQIILSKNEDEESDNEDMAASNKDNQKITKTNNHIYFFRYIYRKI